MYRLVPPVAALALLLVPSVADAQGWRGGGQGVERRFEIERRLALQEERLEGGLRSGQLTRSEHSELRRSQSRIHRDFRRAAGDGFVSRLEFDEIARLLGRQDRRIARQSNDPEMRGGRFR